MKKTAAIFMSILVALGSVFPVSSEESGGYDPRGTDKVSSVRSQGTSGACWAFAALACVEQDLIAQGKENSSVDLSETALVMAAGGNDPFSQAGSAAAAEIALASGKGVCYESFEPFIAYDPGSACVSEYKKNVCEYGLLEAKKIGKDEVKSEIKEHGAVYVSHYYNEKYLNSEAYYAPSSGLINHAAAIVGWDDSYSKYNFISAPENDGAWIVKSSWGTAAGDDGYYYISYDEAELEFTVFDAGDAEDTAYSYADSLPALNLSAEGEISTACVFTAQTEQDISRAGFLYMSDEEADYEIKICGGVSDGSPEGELIASASGKINSKGFYSAELTASRKIAGGETFSAIVTLKGKKPSAAAMKGRSSAEGKCYIKGSGDWSETSDYGAGAPYIFAYANEDPTSAREELRAQINRLYGNDCCERELVYALKVFKNKKSSAGKLKNALNLLLAAEDENDEALIIKNAEDWKAFSDRVSDGEDFSGKLVVLGADIDFDGETIAPVGNDENTFSGLFDGRGHIIKNAVIDSGDGIYSGLFSAVSGRGSVVGVTAENCRVLGMSAGGICGKAECFEIRKCAFYGDVSGADYEGGIAGEAKGVMISDCIADKTDNLSRDNITERIYPTEDKVSALKNGIWERSGDLLHEKRSIYDKAYGIRIKKPVKPGGFCIIHFGIMEEPTVSAIITALNSIKAAADT